MAVTLALNLNHDAITLLHDTGAGWVSLGHAQLDASDFPQQLAELRATATRVGGMDYATLLIIPDSQILYTSASASGIDRFADEERVVSALDGATPYAVNELRYDWGTMDDRLRIAVVARETLDEAEAFAAEHGFRPVGFTAIPDEGRFDGAPWFGPTGSAHEIAPAEDLAPKSAITITGEVSREELAALIAEVTQEAEASTEEDNAAQPADSDTTEAAPDRELSDTPDRAAPDTSAELDIAEVKETPAAPAPPAAEAEAKADPAPSELPAETDENAGDDDAPAPTFASRRTKPAEVSPAPGRRKRAAQRRAAAKAQAEKDAASTASPQEDDTPAPKPKKRGKAGKKAAADAPAPDKTSEKDTDTVPSFASIRPKRSDDGSSAPKLSGPKPTDDAAMRPPPPVLAEPKPDRKSKPAKKKRTPAPKAKAKDTTPDAFVAATASTLTAAPAKPSSEPPSSMAKLKGLVARKQDAPSDDSADAEPTPSADEEREALTTFGARDAQREDLGVAPGRAGLFLSAAIVVLLLIVGVWASIAFRVEIEAWLRSNSTSVETAVATPSDTTLPTPEEVRVPDVDAVPELASIAPTAPQVSGAAAPQLPGAPDVLASLPSQLESPQVPRTGVADQRVARLEPGLPQLPAPVVEETARPAEATQTDDPDLDALLDDAEPEIVTLSPEETAARYAATGIWQSAPEQPIAPPETDIDRLYLASIDPTVQGTDAVDLPRSLAALRDRELPRQLNPAVPGAEALLGEDGLVTPSPGGTPSPLGILVYSGPPPSGAPPRRPGVSDPPVAAAPSALSELAQSRPRSRPEGLSEDRQRAQLGGRTLAELATVRPRLRPAEVVEAALAIRAEQAQLAEEEAADLAAKARAEAEAAGRAGASPLAVTASLQPRNRPAGLAARAARSQTASAPADDGGSSGPAVQRSQRLNPDAPTPASVARQATEDNAIRLNRINLIGVFGTPNDRRALVRMPSGRLLRLKIGDRVDGGRVAAIGDGELSYTKGGRNITLRMPRG